MKNIPYLLSAIALLVIMLSVSSCLIDDEGMPTLPYLNNYRLAEIVAPGETLVVWGHNLNKNVQLTINKQAIPYTVHSEDSLSVDIDDTMYSGQLVATYEGDTILNEYLKIKDDSWQLIHSADNSILSMTFLNEAFGYFSAGDNVYKLSASGIGSVLTGKSLEPIQVIDENTVFVHRTEWQALRTTDGGDSWDEISLPEGFVAYTIHFSSALDGLSLGNFSDGESSAIFLTQDGGDSWQEVFYSDEKIFDYYSEVWVYALSDQEFRVVDQESGTLISSNDGGQSWVKTKLNMPFDNFFSGNVHFLDENTLWVSNYKGHFSTVDGGANWEKRDFGLEAEDNVLGVYFFDSENGVFVSGGAGIAKTTDGGKSWKVRHINNSGLRSVNFLKPSRSIIAGSGYDIMISEF